MSAALLSLAEKSFIEMKKGEFDQLYVKGTEGYLLVLQAGPNAVLIVSTTKDIRLGKIFLNEIIDFDRMNDGDDYFPYPYVFKPPTPPDDIAPVGQLQVKRPITEEEAEFEPYCRHCGAKLAKGQTLCHVCRKKID